jgi:hypothetical protein
MNDKGAKRVGHILCDTPGLSGVFSPGPTGETANYFVLIGWNCAEDAMMARVRRNMPDRNIRIALATRLLPRRLALGAAVVLLRGRDRR